jgi:hypothetical protein
MVSRPVIRKLDDNFGDYDLTARCRGCGHRRVIQQRQLARWFGWQATLESIETRLLCFRCQEKDCELVATVGRKPRGVRDPRN